MTEIYFNPTGNTIVGNYGAYSKLDRAIEAKQVFEPHGHVVKGEPSDIVRLAEYVAKRGHGIKTLAGFVKAVERAGCTIQKEEAQ